MDEGAAYMDVMRAMRLYPIRRSLSISRVLTRTPRTTTRTRW